MRRRYEIAGWTVGAIGVVVVFSLIFHHPSFTSTTSFVPQTAERSRPAGLQAVAGQFGISIPGESGSESPQFYADLLLSRPILREVLDQTYEIEFDEGLIGSSGDSKIVDLMGFVGDTPGLREAAGLQWLREEVVKAFTNVETGVVEVSVTTPWPGLSKEVAEQLLELVNDFNLRTRQSQASAERRFIETRLEQAQHTLRLAEDSLKRFLEANRAFANSPDLVFEYERLQRKVAMRQQLYTSLAQSHEQSTIAEVRNTPVITVIDPPEAPVRPDPHRLMLKGFLAALAGAIMGGIVGLAREMIAFKRSRPDEEFEEFQQAWAETLSDLRGLVRWAERFRGGTR